MKRYLVLTLLLALALTPPAEALIKATAITASGTVAAATLTASADITGSVLWLTSTAEGARLNKIAGDAGTLESGELWYDSTANVLKFYNGTAVKTLFSGSVVNPQVIHAQSAGVGITAAYVTLDSAFADTNYYGAVSFTSDDFLLWRVSGKDVGGYTVTFEANPDGCNFDALGVHD